MVVSIKDFVKTALLEISEGVIEARKLSRVNIAPGYVEGIPQIVPQMVTFELLVEVTSEKSLDANGAIEIPFLGVLKASTKFDGQASKAALNSQKIGFSVPIYFQAPTQEGDR